MYIAEGIALLSGAEGPGRLGIIRCIINDQILHSSSEWRDLISENLIPSGQLSDG